jgi:TonB family protein
MVSDGDNGSTSSLEGMQLLSDPKNVDFRPYMQLVASQVRQQWLRMGPSIGGTRITVIQVHIDRQGRVPKMTVSRNSGAVVFDQAAVASLSSATPFPPLPAEFSGGEIQIQLTFTNFPRVP